MSEREVLEHQPGEDLALWTPTAPVRLCFKRPDRGGPTLASLRKVLSPKGRLRFSATGASLFVDVDPGVSEPPLVAFDTIARSDAAGLTRAIVSCLSEVDQIVIGIDGRSDEATRETARQWADVVWEFQAADIGLSQEEWEKDRIHFANARNLGRDKVTCPWTFVIDADEYLERGDVRAAIRDAERRGHEAAGPLVRINQMAQHDVQRLAKTSCRWHSAVHNQLGIQGEADDADLVIIGDTSLRPKVEDERRAAQRNSEIEKLAEIADKDLVALFHVAKHRLCFPETFEEGVKLAQDYRFKAEVHGILAPERAWLALCAATNYYSRDDFTNAELWAQRSMLDGPRVEAMCVLGDVAEDRGELMEALGWYEAACALPEIEHKLQTPGMSQLRWGRLAGIQRALGKLNLRLQLEALVSQWRQFGPTADGAGLTPSSVYRICADAVARTIEVVKPDVAALVAASEKVEAAVEAAGEAEAEKTDRTVTVVP